MRGRVGDQNLGLLNTNHIRRLLASVWSCLLIIAAGTLNAAPKDQRLDIIHIANLRGDYERLARLLTYKDKRSDETPQLILLGTDVFGTTGLSHVDPEGKIFLKQVLKFAEKEKIVFLPGRSDLLESPEKLKEIVAELRSARVPVVASNYKGPLKGMGSSQIVNVAGAKVAVISLLANDPYFSPHKLGNPMAEVRRVVNDLAKTVDGIVVVTNLHLPEQRALARLLATSPAGTKILGLFGADPREKAERFAAPCQQRVFGQKRLIIKGAEAPFIEDLSKQ